VLSPGSIGYGLPSSSTHFPGLTSRISPYETRSSGYRSQSNVRNLAPSLQTLTGKRSLTYSVAPFIVELFTAGRLNRSPEWSPPVSPVTRRQLPTPAALSDLAEARPNPTDGIFQCSRIRVIHRRELTPAARPRSVRHRSTRFACRYAAGKRRLGRPSIDTALPDGKVCPHRPSSRPIPMCNSLSLSLPRLRPPVAQLDRTLGLLRGSRIFITNEACDQRDYSNEPPLN